MAINKVEYGGNTLIDITDTTATDNDVSNGQVYYRANGTRGVGTLVNPDVQINGTSIVSNGVADIITEGTYNASTNKIATISDVPTNLENGTGTNSIKLTNSGSATGNFSVSLNGSASGTSAVAEGAASASGDYSHAEGGGTIASGDYSHAEGLWTVAASDYQHVFGKYNITDSNDTYVEIVGNGIDDNNQSNAYTLDWNGNGVYAGKVTVGADPTNAMDVATKQYVDNKNIMYGINASTVTTTQNTYHKIPIKESTNIGNELSIDSGGIKIGSGISYIMVSGTITFERIASGRTHITLYKNNAVQKGIITRLGGNWETAQISNVLIPVQENDIIYLYTRTQDAGNALTEASTLTVEVIK